ncbi:hypothetical protein JS528_01550 [Bifidobacterium sp. MA2]|uniref:ABC transporter permease n=1 Tax=Bifidobacterium santillanense TaxID=2809028 RepID=A0ABS5UME8_9BIFI|nr:hypothetical protein [Bifidobacterium santillanense]MBT1172066.1 hypothetical protein [Bifidobacterium santillanense]
MTDENMTPGTHPALRMTLRGVVSEAWRDLITGTTHACTLALCAASLILLLAGADWLTVSSIQRQVDGYVAAGGSTWILQYDNHIDGAACDRLSSLDGVQAAGALREGGAKLTFAALSSTGVPTYEVTAGAMDVFALSTTGTDDGTAQPATRRADGTGKTSGTAADASADAASDDSPDGSWAGGVMLSAEAAKPFGAAAGTTLALRDGRELTVADVFDWPDDGRKSGFSYAALTPVPADDAKPFGQCWVRAWPEPEGIESLLRLASDRVATGADQTRPMISRLNTSKGSVMDGDAMFAGRLTAYAPWIALAGGLLLGLVAARSRRLELASALHCGVPKSALVAQMLIETCAWTIAGALITSPLLAWIWAANDLADARSIVGTLLRVPVAASVGVLAGTLAAVLATRESHLLRYFKNR